MKIDYFCFSVPDLNSTDYLISETDDENITWIKTQEKKLMDTAREHGMLILFDRTSKKFYFEQQEIDVKDKIIFPRSFIPYEKELLEELEENGAISLQTRSDLEGIENWPQKIQPIHRRVIQTSYEEFQLHAETYKSIFQTVFFKTAKKTHTHCILKFYGHVDIDGTKYFATKPILRNINLNDSVFLSEAFQPIKDVENNMSCKEYRAFIINNSLLSVSRSYVDYPTEVPKDVIDFLEEQIKKAANTQDFPSSYVLDVGEVFIDGKEVIDIIEYNPISSSGLEVCNLLVDAIISKKQPAHSFTKKFHRNHSYFKY